MPESTLYRMLRHRLLAVALTAGAVLFLGSCSSDPGPRLVAVTLDDAPIMNFHGYASPWHRAQAVDSLISTLQHQGVPATVFAIGSEIEASEPTELLQRWAAAAFPVANHSYSHQSFNGLSRSEGVVELTRTSALIRRSVGSAATAPWFRFPFLEEGATEAQREGWAEVLDSLGLRSARVTLSTDDWRYDRDYVEAENEEDWARRFEIGQAYLEHVKQSIRQWDALSRTLFRRNVKHVLMLHANRINRDYLGAILDWMREEGFSFITMDEAYRDPLYREVADWTSATGMSYLEHIKQTRIAAGTYTE